MTRASLTIGLILVLLSSCKKNDESFVISKLQNASKLATTETVIDKVIVGYKEKRLVGLVKIGTAEFVANSKAYIKTGIDLNDLKPEDVTIDGKSISIDLPQIKVLDFSYPFDQFEIDRGISDDDFLNRITIHDQENFYRKSELDIRQNLKYTGIIESTENNTRKMMTSILNNLGYEFVFIDFKKGDDFLDQLDEELFKSNQMKDN